MRQAQYCKDYKWDTFQSTHPVWDATIDANTDAADALQFQSTHPVWDATLASGKY